MGCPEGSMQTRVHALPDPSTGGDLTLVEKGQSAKQSPRRLFIDLSGKLSGLGSANASQSRNSRPKRRPSPIDRARALPSRGILRLNAPLAAASVTTTLRFG